MTPSRLSGDHPAVGNVDASSRLTGPRVRPHEVKQIFDCAETSQGLLDAFFQICAGYFPTCSLLLFVTDDVIIRRVQGLGAASSAVGARFSRDASPALGPVHGGGDLGAAAVTIESTDALVVCGAWPAPGEALLLPLVVRGRTAAAVLGVSAIGDAERKDVLAIMTAATTALTSLITRRSKASGVSEATRIMSAPLIEEEVGRRRKRFAKYVSIGSGVVVAAAMLWWFFGGRQSPLQVKIGDIPGQPRVDAVALVPFARKASDLGDRAELLEIRATVAPDSKTNLKDPGLGSDAWPLQYTFAVGDEVADIDVDGAGIYPPTQRGRGALTRDCGTCGCDIPAPTPHCAVSKVIEAARGVGLGPTESAVLTYGFCRSEGPRWTVYVPGRGEVRVSDATCAPLARESLHIAPRKLDAFPGAPKLNVVKLLAEARAQAAMPADAVLVRLEAWFVARDGNVDLIAAGRQGRAEYTFADPPGTQPVRVRRVVLDSEGMSVRLTEIATTPMRPAPAPACNVTKLWRSSITDAPASALAHIIYEADAVAPDPRGSWTIELASSAVHHVRSDALCAAWE